MLEPAERKMIYAFLSVLFSYPDEETLALMGGVEEGTFETVFPGLAAPPLSSLPELRRGYEHLFTSSDGRVPAPPYGSAYLEKPGNAGMSTRLVASLYTGAGLDPGCSPQPPDYLPTELEFLYYLTEGEQQSREGAAGAAPQRWLASEADFFHNFFSPWIAPFCDRIAGESNAHPFYRWAADLLRRFVQLESGRLKKV